MQGITTISHLPKDVERRLTENFMRNLIEDTDALLDFIDPSRKKKKKKKTTNKGK